MFTMPSIDLYTQSGEKKGALKLNEKIFGLVSVNADLIHDALIRQDSHCRRNIAHTKTRAEVRGGGRKSRPQKGSGNSRQGGIRNIHMKGGGVAFGPRNNRNFYLRMPKKQRRLALFGALSLKVQDSEVLALESYENAEIKTSVFSQMIKNLPLNGKVLFVIPVNSDLIQLSAKNLPNVKVILAHNLNVKDVITFKNVLFLKDSISKIEEIFSNSVKSK